MHLTVTITWSFISMRHGTIDFKFNIFPSNSFGLLLLPLPVVIKCFYNHSFRFVLILCEFVYGHFFVYRIKNNFPISVLCLHSIPIPFGSIWFDFGVHSFLCSIILSINMSERWVFLCIHAPAHPYAFLTTVLFLFPSCCLVIIFDFMLLYVAFLYKKKFRCFFLQFFFSFFPRLSF